ncbi:MAG TPA: gluconate 2-dehydrogenase subunit 3 family protein [Steroidobacteraceae bacterium]
MESGGGSRRDFLQVAGGTLGVAWLATHWPGIAAAAEHAHEAMSADTADRSKFVLLTAAQARDVDAIAAQIVPGGATPGAHEAGVVYFIDHVHAGVWKNQSAGFLERLDAFRASCAKHYGGATQFADLAADDQRSFLEHMQHTPYFGELRFLTILGLLALPSYGGNAGKAGWRLVGFVDRHVWDAPYGEYDKDYPGFQPYPGTQVQS